MARRRRSSRGRSGRPSPPRSPPPITRRSRADLEPTSPHLSRLAYDELLASQLALAILRHRQRKSVGAARIGDGRLKAKILAALPFTLTGSQATALAEIDADLAKPERMLRLLQGDVGSGKTVVALLAAASVIESGAQAAIMAPTELLVRQHARTIAPLADAAGIRIAVLTGRERGREREDDARRPRRRATSTSSSAPTPSSRPASSSATSGWSSSTSSTASASTSASPSPPRARRPTSW